MPSVPAGRADCRCLCRQAAPQVRLAGLGLRVGCAACYVLGTIWFMVLTGLDLPTSLTYCVIPYLPGDVIKIALASLLTIQLDKRMPKI